MITRYKSHLSNFSQIKEYVMKKQRIHIILNALLALVLVFSMLAVSAGPALADQEKTPSMDPDFLALVQEHPNETFRVIVQRDAKNKDLKDMELENWVQQGGGHVGKQLGLVESFSAEMKGKKVEQLAKNHKVRWISPDAPVVSMGSGGLSSVIDRFEGQVYTGNDGTDYWAADWSEGGHDQPVIPHGGVFMVNYGPECEGGDGYCLRIDPYFVGSYVYRSADLSGASSVTLSFYRNNQILADTGAVALQVSADGGATWTTLQNYSASNLVGSGTDTFDITDYASPNTQIRFYVTSSQLAYYYIYFDDIQIEYAVSSVYRDVVGAQALWDQSGFDGDGVTVAVVDSGITDHMDLRESDLNPTQALNSSSRVVQNLVFGEYASPADEYVHGSHVAGIIAGNGVASGGKYVGVAPGVNLINIRVSNFEGLTYTSDLIDGLQWLMDNKDTYNIRVLNLSINSTAPESYNNSPLDAAVEILWFNGIVVVVAAGNNGTADGPSTVYPPANDPFVITVGAAEDRGTTTLDDDFVGEFSAYNTTEDGFAKPDLVAPGRNLISLLSDTNSTGYTNHPKHRVDDFYFRMSGTSMAAPVVTGAVALLLQAEPNLTPDQVKYRLMATANQNWPGYDQAKAGAGMVDAFAAVNGTTTDSANIGIVPSQMLATGDDAVAFDSVGWNSVGWNSVGWNSVGWNSVGWNSVGWNSVGWNSDNLGSSTWDD
jgi:serine protease AprX